MYRGDKMEKDYEVLCGASSYEKKFYINEAFANLPDSIKDELKINNTENKVYINSINLLKSDVIV